MSCQLPSPAAAYPCRLPFTASRRLLSLFLHPPRLRGRATRPDGRGPKAREAEHPGVIFRPGPTGRRAALAGGPSLLRSATSWQAKPVPAWSRCSCGPWLTGYRCAAVTQSMDCKTIRLVSSSKDRASPVTKDTSQRTIWICETPPVIPCPVTARSSGGSRCSSPGGTGGARTRRVPARGHCVLGALTGRHFVWGGFTTPDPASTHQEIGAYDVDGGDQGGLVALV